MQYIFEDVKIVFKAINLLNTMYYILPYTKLVFNIILFIQEDKNLLSHDICH